MAVIEGGRLRLVALAAVVVGVAAVGAAADEATAGCGSASGSCVYGLPAGVYTTGSFLPGMRVRVPGGGWQLGEDSPTELKLYPPGYAPNDFAPAIRFWIDPRASTPCSDQPLSVAMTTPASVLRWMRSNKNLIVSSRGRATVAGHFLAIVVEVDVRRSAPRCDPACATACIDYFLFKAPGRAAEPYGTGPGELVRLYLAKIGPPAHVFVLGTDVGSVGSQKKVFASLNASAAKFANSLRLPARLPPKRP